MHRRCGSVLPLLLLGAILAACASGPSSHQGEARIRLIAFNDFHGHLLPAGHRLPGGIFGDAEAGDVAVGGAMPMATLIAALRRERPSIVVAAGDLIGASPPESGLFHDEPTIVAMNALGLQYSALGNHEFDEGLAELQRMRGGGCRDGANAVGRSCVGGAFTGARFQYLAANVRRATDGQPAFPASVIHGLKTDMGRVQVGIIGAVVRDTPELVSVGMTRGLVFGDEADAVNAEARRLTAAGVRALVLLIHEGAKPAGDHDGAGCPPLSGALMPILQRLDAEIDVVVSGHTHRAYTCRIDGRLVTSSGAHGGLVTAIDLQVDSRGQVTGGSARNYPVINDSAPPPSGYRVLPPDGAMAAALQPHLDAAAPVTGRIVARLAESFDRVPDAAGQSALGRLVADAQLAATRQLGAQLALMNPGGLRADLGMRPLRGEGPGEVSYGELFTVQPFGNTLVVVEMSGAQLLAALEQQFSAARERVLQHSGGLSYRFERTAPAGQRVDVTSVRLHGVRVLPRQRYRVAVNSFLAGGGDGFVMFSQGTKMPTGIQDVDALAQHLGALPQPVRRSWPSPAGVGGG